MTEKINEEPEEELQEILEEKQEQIEEIQEGIEEEQIIDEEKKEYETKEEKKPVREDGKKEMKKKEKPKDAKEVKMHKTAKEAQKENVYTIPLRKAFKKTENKRATYSIRLIRDFLSTHMKSDNIKIGKHLNEIMFEKRNPPRKVRVKAIKEGDIVKAELMGYEYVEFMAKPKMEKKGMKEKLMERLGPKALKKQEEEEAFKDEKKKPAEEVKEDKIIKDTK